MSFELQHTTEEKKSPICNHKVVAMDSQLATLPSNNPSVYDEIEHLSDNASLTRILSSTVPGEIPDSSDSQLSVTLLGVDMGVPVLLQPSESPRISTELRIVLPNNVDAVVQMKKASGLTDECDVKTGTKISIDSPMSIESKDSVIRLESTNLSMPITVHRDDLPLSNSVEKTVHLCNRSTASIDENSSIESNGVAIINALAISRPMHVDLSNDEHVMRTPGDGAETTLDAIPLNQVTSSSPSFFQSESDQLQKPMTSADAAVFDVTSEEDLSRDLELFNPSSVSPATIEVDNLNLEGLVTESNKQRRPKSLDGYFLQDGNSPRWPSPSKSHSLRTTPSASNPQFLEEFKELADAEEVLDTPSELSQEGHLDSSSRNPNLSGILQHELRSRASFTSISSLSTDYSSSLATDDLSESRDGLEPGFVEVSLHSHQTSPRDHWAFAAHGAKPKKRGLAGFLARNLFPWKSSTKSDQAESTGLPASPTGGTGGWKLFGRSPAKQTSTPKQFDLEYPSKGKTHPPTLSLNWRRKQSGMRPASSTTALILENRPLHLPAKNPDEEQKHKEQYKEMVEGAKRKEMKVCKQQMKKLAKQLKYEEGVKTLLHVWKTEILKNWETVKHSKRTREMWWQGIPPSIRGRVWLLAIGNELNITPELFEIFLARAKDRIKVFSEPDTEDVEEVHQASREDSVDVIRLDVSRTFPHLCIYQKGGPYFDRLHSVLGAYACYRPDIGYVQGMSFIAAVFLLYLEASEAFCCFANVLNRPCQLSFFRLDQPVMQSYFDTYEEYFEDNLPDLYSHFRNQCLTPDLYIIDWMYTLYTKSLPLNVACRFLDVFFKDGEEFIFRTALGILHLYEDILVTLEFIHLAQFLTKLPEDMDCDALFHSIETIDIHQKKFSQVLSIHMANHSHTQ